MHAMNLINEHEGMEEWLCPICGRHMLVNWRPRFKRTVIVAGDASVPHSGFKNETQPDEMVVTPVDETLPREETYGNTDEARLIPWAIWMDKSDFADLWNGSVQ